MDIKRTMTMNWDGLGTHEAEDDDFFDSNNRISAVVPMDDFFDSNNRISAVVPMDDFFDSNNRISAVVPMDDFFDSNNRISAVVPMDLAGAASSGSSDDEFEDPRMSFASGSTEAARLSSVASPTPSFLPSSNEEYDIWMAAPTSIEERRRRLLQGMGLNSSKELMRLRTMAMSKKMMNAAGVAPPLPPSSQGKDSAVEGDQSKHTSSSSPTKNSDDCEGEVKDDHSLSPSPDNHFVLVRSRSDGDIDQFSIETKRRKEQLIGNVSKQSLTRTSSTLVSFTRLCNVNYSSATIANDNGNVNNGTTNTKNCRKPRIDCQTNNGGEEIGAFFLIKNLDTGKEFVVKEFNKDGMWNRLSDLQTGRQLTMEEFEKSVGYSPVVKELMRREHVRRNGGDVTGLERKSSVNAYLSKSFRYSKRRGVSILKNINRVANSVTGLGSAQEKDYSHSPAVAAVEPPVVQKGGKGANHSNEWVRVRTQGKAYKELTALRFCQEIQAHEGSIWTMKFSVDGRYLASAGEDKVIHIWEVQECEIASLKVPDESANASPLHPMCCPSPDRDRPPLAPDMSGLEKKKKGKSSTRKGGVMPDYVKLPETVFSLSSEPVCSFKGHLDDVLDLSWSSQMCLLSSSMDKTVRLWDMETKACLKLFAHNDYVTCIHFNPVNDDYFISGSLDAKVRLWNVSGRRVVDWTDLHEMVTAACYTPDGQGAVVGSHKGNCRMYSITDGKLNQTSQFDILNKKKAAPKKITGFEFTSDNPDEVLVTSADSRIRIYDGTEEVQKFRGFRNTSSQIAASFSPDGSYVICGSEDSNVYVWKKEEHKNGKTKTIINTRSHEHFQCKDVSVAIPWPGSIKFDPPTIQLNPKRNSKRVTAPVPPASVSGSPRKEDAPKNNKRNLPPLPNKKSSNAVEKTDSNNNNNINDDNSSSSNNNNDNDNNDSEKAPDSPESDPSQVTSTESDPSQVTRTESGVGDSFNSTAGSSIRYGDSPSMSSNNAPSPSWSSGWSWFDGGGNHAPDSIQARAWGLVIVTAGLGGEIRAYQNFGVPVRVGRQTNLFSS